MRTLLCFVFFPHLSPQFQLSLSAAALGMYLQGPKHKGSTLEEGKTLVYQTALSVNKHRLDATCLYMSLINSSLSEVFKRYSAFFQFNYRFLRGHTSSPPPPPPSRRNVFLTYTAYFIPSQTCNRIWAHPA
jgi:hypothetical protein